MKHCIIFKFKEKPSTDNADIIFNDIEGIFSGLNTIDGINGITFKRNCINRENRYDGMIEIDMNEDVLPIYDESGPHKLWKEKYSDKLEKKAIIDFSE